MDKLHFDGPVVLAILDGVGLAPNTEGNAVAKANTPFLEKAIQNNFVLGLEASGEAVGLLKGVMGNSEVGHNTMGCGQIIKNGIAAIEDAFNSGSIWHSSTWNEIVSRVQNDSTVTVHFAGIFSDGRTHSDINHLEKMVAKIVEAGAKKIRVHCMIDGRDVPPQSEPKYIDRFENFAKQFDADIKIASGGGRMTTTCDRYGNEWGMVQRGFNMMVHGISNNHFHSATAAISGFRKKDPEIQDQYLPDFVITDENDQPVGKIEKGDVVIYYDFRADRAIEIAEAFTERDFTKFNRGNEFVPSDIYFVGLTEYDVDKHLPENQLIHPNYITNTLNEFLNKKRIRELAVSETVKFGHITYYFNGNSREETPLEKSIEIKSYEQPFNTCPWMKAVEIADTVIDNLDKYDFIRLNFPNGDMIGHFAEMDSSIIAVESVDLQLARIAKKVDELGGVMIVTADHGNVEELLDEDGKPKTSHTTNLVPFVLYDNTSNKNKYVDAKIKNPGIANIAATIAELLGYDDYPENWQKPLIVIK